MTAVASSSITGTIAGGKLLPEAQSCADSPPIRIQSRSRAYQRCATKRLFFMRWALKRPTYIWEAGAGQKYFERPASKESRLAPCGSQAHGQGYRRGMEGLPKILSKDC